MKKVLIAILVFTTTSIMAQSRDSTFDGGNLSGTLISIGDDSSFVLAYKPLYDTIKVQFLLSSNNDGTKPYMQIPTFVRNGYIIRSWEGDRYLNYWFTPLPKDEIIWDFKQVDWIDKSGNH